MFLIWSWNVCFMISLESSHRGDSNEYTTFHYCIENRKEFPKLSAFASWPGTMIDSQWLELPIPRPWSQRYSSHWNSTVITIPRIRIFAQRKEAVFTSYAVRKSWISLRMRIVLSGHSLASWNHWIENKDVHGNLSLRFPYDIRPAFLHYAKYDNGSFYMTRRNRDVSLIMLYRLVVWVRILYSVSNICEMSL